MVRILSLSFVHLNLIVYHSIRQWSPHPPSSRPLRPPHPLLHALILFPLRPLIPSDNGLCIPLSMYPLHQFLPNRISHPLTLRFGALSPIDIEHPTSPTFGAGAFDEDTCEVDGTIGGGGEGRSGVEGYTG